MEETIPQKQYYTIGEVSRITGVRPHTLRYWESRGKMLRPTRRKSRHRLYRPADIQLIFELKRLREEEKMHEMAVREGLQETDLRSEIENFEKKLIEKVLKETKGNKGEAAKRLKLSRQSLQYKLKKYNI